MENKKKRSWILIVLLLLVGLTSGYVVSTYAKYTAEISRGGSATVAKWSFEGDNSTSTFNINLAENYDASTLVNDRIAPGTSGSFDIALVNTNSETGVNFTVKVGTVTASGTGGVVPANLKFYKDAAHTTELTASGITGQLTAGDSTGKTVTIYWQWAYETGTVTDGIATGDEADNTAGAAGSTLTVPVTVSGVQTTPNTTAITSHID